MSNTPELSKAGSYKPKSSFKPLNFKPKSKSRHRKRRDSDASNASIISIDPVSLRSLRKFQDKLAKENQKQKYIYRQQKKSKFDAYTNKFIDNELKEEDEYKFDDKTLSAKPSKMQPYDESTLPISKKTKIATNTNADLEDITVGELLPLIKNLVDRHNKLQTEYDVLDRQLREQKIVMEDKITQLQDQQIDFDGYDNLTAYEDNNNKMQIEYEDKISILKNNYENNVLSMQSECDLEVESLKKEIKTLHADWNEIDKENEALRQSLQVLQHENESLRISINENNKRFQNIKLFKNRNKQLEAENDAFRQQIDSLEQELDLLIIKQQQLQHAHDQNPENAHTPSLVRNKTLLIGNKDQLDNKSLYNNTNLSDSGGNLLHQIGDLDGYASNRHSSADPPDRDSNYEEYEDEDDEKKINDHDHDDDDDDGQGVLAKLSKFKRNISSVDPDSMQQILQLLQEKEHRRLGNHSQPSQDVVANYSVTSNYSDSEQGIKEQMDNMEDDIRELKEMLLSLMDCTNNVTPQINANLGPLVRKINRMYLMLSGPMGPPMSRSSEVHNDSSFMNRSQMQHNLSKMKKKKSFGYDSEFDNASERSSGRGDGGNEEDGTVYGWLMPYVNDWMPSVGFSAIILSTMYLLIKYHKGSFVGIGRSPPRVLRNKKRGKLM